MSRTQGVPAGRAAQVVSTDSVVHRAAVLGHPVAHSLSPALHRAAYAALDLADWRYDAIDVTSEQLAGFVNDLDATWAGLSLTMPLKQTVLPLLDHIEPLADVVGAVNTVLIQGAGPRRMLVGANTDVYGIVSALGEALPAVAPASATGAAANAPVTAVTPSRTAAVLGAGATAASTLAALAQLGCPTPVVYVRSLGRIGSLMRAAHRMGVEPRYALLPTAAGELPQFDLVVSTLPAHAADDVAAELALTSSSTGIGGVLLDVVYEPRPTQLSLAWAQGGGVVAAGERMLLHQAVEQVRLMTGRIAPVAAMERALADQLNPRSTT